MKGLDSTTHPDEIQIHVVGTSGSGKTTIQILIADALRAQGFDVHVETKPDFNTESDLRKRYDMYSEDRGAAIRSRVKKITINEVQAKRIPYK
jgi:ABC-type glutathione transport system ATPase component